MPTFTVLRWGRPLFVAASLFASAALAQEPARRAGAADAAPQGSGFTLACAQRDLVLLTLVEHRGDARTAPGEMLFKAWLTIDDARRSCAAGREAEALSIYDSAERALGSTPVTQ